MSNRQWFEEPEEFISVCDDCPNPNGCITRCGIQEYFTENQDVAYQRSETPMQLHWEMTNELR